MRSWQSGDLAFALSKQQLRNHLLHGAVAAVITILLLRYDLPNWTVALLAVAAVAFGKEYVEVMRRIRLDMAIHWWDGVLDAIGWIFFWGVTWAVYSQFVR